MTEIPQLSPTDSNFLHRLLNDLDACTASKSETLPEIHNETLREIEACLSLMTPVEEADVFKLMARLNDKSLSDATREKIAANLGSAAPFTAARFKRVSLWIKTREDSVFNSRGEQKAALDCIDKAIGIISVAQAALGKAEISNLMTGLECVIGDVLNQLLAAVMTLSISETMLTDPHNLLEKLLAEDRAEAQLFGEVKVAIIQ